MLVTGAAGFIGFHLSRRLIAEGLEVLGLDNLNDYYSVALKRARLAELEGAPGFEFTRCDIADAPSLEGMVARFEPDVVVNLAAQAGVRYSLENPSAYVESNLVGFANVLEACRHHGVRHLVYASSSSVYGGNKEQPFRVAHSVDHPLSLYAATKKSNELMAHTYAHLFRLPVTGLRFFTVYGPWGRPDMAAYLFADAIRSGKPIKVFNHGNMKRDFTYIDDIVEGVFRLLGHIPSPCEAGEGPVPPSHSTTAPYRLYNIGNSSPVHLMDMIGIMEECLGRKAEKKLMPIPPGDVPETYADVSGLEEDIGFRPETPLREGMQRFIDWYLAYHGGK